MTRVLFYTLFLLIVQIVIRKRFALRGVLSVRLFVRLFVFFIVLYSTQTQKIFADSFYRTMTDIHLGQKVIFVVGIFIFICILFFGFVSFYTIARIVFF